jgi:hypothetical protein
MATISNTPRPGYVWDSTDNVWYPIGVGGHGHPDYITQATAVNPTIIDAKGDIITATAADTPARLAVGNNGETLVADSSTATGLSYQENYAAGKNKIMNGDFSVNQRNFTTTTTTAEFNFDRWRTVYSGGTSTTTAETFTLGAAPVAGYEGKNFYRVAITGQASATDFVRYAQAVESVRTFAGDTTTYSFWAKASSGTPKIAFNVSQYFGTGGSPSATVTTNAGTVTLSTSWARYSVTVAIPSISGKTIGTDNNSTLSMRLFLSAGASVTEGQSIGYQNVTIDTWGHQWESSSVATAFQTATGTIQGELAACQRYYYRITGTNNFSNICPAYSDASNNAVTQLTVPVELRVAPTSVDFSNIRVTNFSFGAAVTSASVSSAFNGKNNVAINLGVAGTPLTGASPFNISCNNNAAGYLGVSAEL